MPLSNAFFFLPLAHWYSKSCLAVVPMPIWSQALARSPTKTVVPTKLVHPSATKAKDATRGSGRTTRNKKLLGAPGIATGSKHATGGSWPY